MPGTDLARRMTYPPAALEKRKPESEAPVPRAFRAVRRNRHVSVPLAVPPVLWAAGEILYANGAGADTAIGGAALAGAVWFFAPHKWDRKAEQWYARLSAAGAAGWLSAAAWAGPASGLPGEILGGTLIAGTGAWGVLWWRHKRPRGMRRRQKMITYWDAWWQGHCRAWNLAGSRVIDAKETGVTIRLRVQLWAGRQSLVHVRQAVHLIESGLEGIVTESGRVRAEGVKGNLSQADLFFKRENPLREVVEWDPALAPASVHEQAVDGLSETGQWVFTPMRINAFVIGRTRAGKSNHLKLRIAQLTGCPDSRQVVIDLKEGRSGRPMLEAAAVDYVITDIAEARMYLLMLTQEIRARAKYCYTGEEQLDATPEVPAIHTFVDETRDLTSVTQGDAECSRHVATVASKGSGLEIYVEVYTQYGSLEESVGTEQTRSNLLLRAVYAVEEPRHGAFAIADYDKFDASKLEEKGTHLLKAGPQAHTEQIRAPKMDDGLLKRIAAANARSVASRPPWRLACGDWPCPAGGTWQEWWDSRWLRLDPDFRQFSPQYAEAAATAAAAAAAAPPGAGVSVGPAQTVTIAPAPSAPGEGDGASVAARIDAETAGPDFFPGKRTAARVGDVMRRQKEAFADALGAASGGISPGQLAEESGMGRTWIHGMLSALVERGAVTQVKRGIYVPAAGADMHEAVAAVDAGTEALVKDARRTVRLHSVS